MDSRTILGRLRLFLLVTAGFIFLATPLELLLIEHFESPQQFIPFLLCAPGVATVALAAFWPRRATLLALRWVMAVVIAGSMIGMYLHIANNLAFELEIRPGAAAGSVLIDALRGASPLLAPGILALAGALAIAATYGRSELDSFATQSS